MLLPPESTQTNITCPPHTHARSYRQRQLEIEDSRISNEQLRLNQEEMSQRQLEESRLRKERGLKMRTEDKQREIEELKPKARSALAARWEESVKSQNNGKARSRTVRTTVISGQTEVSSGWGLRVWLTSTIYF